MNFLGSSNDVLGQIPPVVGVLHFFWILTVKSTVALICELLSAIRA